MSNLPVPDELIFLRPIPGRRTPEEWQSIAAHLAGELGSVLSARLDVTDVHVVDEVALRCETTGTSPAGESLLAYRALIGFESIDGEPHVSATVFVYLAGERLAPGGRKAAFVELEYRRPTDGSRGEWHVLGWYDDEYGEYSGFAPARSADVGRR